MRLTPLYASFAALLLLAAGCSGDERTSDITGLGSGMTLVERQLASAEGSNVELCLNYIGLCEQGSALCFEGTNAQTFAGFCTNLANRCRVTISAYCSVGTGAGVAMDGGIAAGGQSEPDAGNSSIDAGNAGITRPDVVVTALAFGDGSFSATVLNQGTGATPDGVVIGVGYFVDGIQVTWGAVPGPLAAGSSVTIGTQGGNYTLMAEGSTHVIMADVDDVNRFSESDESNNQLSRSLSISAPAVVDAGPGAITGPAPFAAPTLVHPVNPMDFGAKCDGITDDSAAFQAAIDASDVLVPSKTCLINRTVRVTTSHKHIECSPGATLLHTDPFAFDMIRIVAYAEPIGDVSVVNCHFLGTNTVAPQYFENDNRHWDIPIRALNTVNDIYIAGNTFERFFGQSMFQTYAPVNGGTGARIEYNTFKSCGYYGPALVASVNGYIGHNTLVDCALGVENDNATQMSGGNIIEYNTLTAIFGYGAPDMHASVMLTGGAAGGANYSTNIVRYNTVSGVGSAAKGSLPSVIYQKNPTGPAQYVGNTCGAGCTIVNL